MEDPYPEFETSASSISHLICKAQFNDLVRDHGGVVNELLIFYSVVVNQLQGNLASCHSSRD